MKFKLWIFCAMALIMLFVPQVSGNIIALKMAIITMCCYLFYYKQFKIDLFDLYLLKPIKKSNMKALPKKITFGTYKGWTFDQLPEYYKQWLIKQKFFNPNL